MTAFTIQIYAECDDHLIEDDGCIGTFVGQGGNCRWRGAGRREARSKPALFMTPRGGPRRNVATLRLGVVFNGNAPYASESVGRDLGREIEELRVANDPGVDVFRTEALTFGHSADAICKLNESLPLITPSGRLGDEQFASIGYQRPNRLHLTYRASG